MKKKTTTCLIIAIIILLIFGGIVWYFSGKISSLLNKNNGVVELFDAYKDFKTGQDTSFSFLVIGDTENKDQLIGPYFEEFIKKANQSNTDFVIHLGDITHNGKEAEFQEVKTYLNKNLNIPYYVVPGNHDIGVNRSENELFLKYFQKEYFSFDHKNSHFIILNNSSSADGFTEDELEFLKDDLSANLEKDQIFIFIHRPVETPVAELISSYDGDSKASIESFNQFKEIIKDPKFKDLISEIYAGHAHTYYSYTLEGIPITISGGGGSKNNLGFIENITGFKHYLEVTVDGKKHQNKVLELGTKETEKEEFLGL